MLAGSFRKYLEKHGIGNAYIDSDSSRSGGDINNSGTTPNHDQTQINLEYLNSYYQRYGNILPKSERGKFPRPTVQQTLEYRLFIEKYYFLFKGESQRRR